MGPSPSSGPPLLSVSGSGAFGLVAELWLVLDAPGELLVLLDGELPHPTSTRARAASEASSADLDLVMW
jgi:hypothetical protein